MAGFVRCRLPCLAVIGALALASSPLDAKAQSGGWSEPIAAPGEPELLNPLSEINARYTMDYAVATGVPAGTSTDSSFRPTASRTAPSTSNGRRTRPSRSPP